VLRDGTVQAAGQGRTFIRVRDGGLADSVAFDVDAAPAVGNVTAPTTQDAATNVATPPITSAPPTGAVSASTPPADASAAEAQMRDQARHIVNQYAAALQSAKIADVLKVFPSMDRRMQDGWNVLFRSVRELDVNMRVVGPITLAGNGGSARVSGEYLYINPSNRKRCRQEVMLLLDFEQLDTGAGKISGARQESSKVSDC
jgi:hypothetical protein